MKLIYAFFVVLLLQVSCYAGDLKVDATISISKPDGSKIDDISVEIARTDAERNRGLMYRRELRDKAGMIFVMPDEVIQSFWMKNTYIPLDMFFISKDGTVNTILKNVPPLSLSPRKSRVPAKFVLELVGGSADRLGIVEGSKLEVVVDHSGSLVISNSEKK